VAGAEKKVADEAKKAERRMKRKAVWVERKREMRVAAATKRRELAWGGRPTGENKFGGPPAGAGTSGAGAPLGGSKVNLEVADTTLSGRVAALEVMLKQQMRGEQKRMQEAYEDGMADQGRKSALILGEMRERNATKERRRTWEREEEKRRVQKEERKRQGTTVKDRLSRKPVDVTTKRLPARVVPRYREHGRDRSPTMRAVGKHSARGEVARRPVSTVARANGYGRGRAQ
jgi:hypothetical protein